jgi:hypothetical protein
MVLNYSKNNGKTVKFAEKIAQAKLLLPLEEMLDRLEDWDLCVGQKRCPFHEDNSPSFSVFTKDDSQYWKCHAGCGTGDQITYLEIKLDLSRGEAIELFLQMAEVARPSNHGEAVGDRDTFGTGEQRQFDDLPVELGGNNSLLRGGWMIEFGALSMPRDFVDVEHGSLAILNE